MVKGRPRHQSDTRLNKKNLDVVIHRHDRLSLVDGIFEMVAEQIKGGHLATGHRLVSVRQMAEDCEVSRDTVVRGYEKLVAHGHLEARSGSGFFVLGGGRAPLRQFDAPLSQRPVLPDWKRLRTLQSVSGEGGSPGSGLLPADWLDEQAMGQALRAMARASQKPLAAYGDVYGYLPLRLQLQAKLKEIHLQVPVDQIMVTAGASDALHLLVLSQLREAGETVLIEDPCSFLLMDRLMASGLSPVGIPRETDGPDIEALRRACEQYHPRFFFCSAVLHNPTCTHIAPHKAYQLLRLAEEFDFIIVEDDTYGDLMPASSATAAMRLASLDQLKRVVYIGSFSKTIAPGLRVGFICGPGDIMEWLLVYRSVAGIAAPQLGERVVYQFLAEGTYRHHCMQLRMRLDQCRQAVADKLIGLGCSFDHVPDAGMYLWATLPDELDAGGMADTLHEQGHQFAPGNLFLSMDNHQFNRKMRFNIARTLGSPALTAFEALLRT